MEKQSPYLKLCDKLSMVELTATWQATRKVNNDERVAKVPGCIGAWKSGKFLPLATIFIVSAKYGSIKQKK